LILLLIKK
jgi:hypothetical protein